MANVPYSGGVPTVEPAARPPEDYQHIPTRPQEFGAELAQGEERLGEGATQAAKFYGQVTAQDSANKWEDETNKILYGDPNVIGPDGQPDRGYYGLRGQAALDAMPGVRQKIVDLRDQYASELSTPEQTFYFNQSTFRLNHFLMDEVGRHYDQNFTIYAGQANKATADLALTGIAQHANDDDFVAHATDKLTSAYVKNLQLSGTETNPEAVQDAHNKARADALEARIEALYPKDPARAQQLLDSPDAALLKGPRYDALSNKLDSANDKAATDAIVNGIVGHGGGQFRAPPGVPIEGATESEQQTLNEIRHRESGGRYDIGGPVAKGEVHTGAYQFADSTWKEAAAATGQGQQYVHAQDAPQAVQDANALWLLRNRGTAPWAESGPYPGTAAPNVRLASASPMQQPVPGFPTREELIGRIPEGLSDRQYDRVYAGVNRRYNQMVQATSADRAQTLEQYKGGLAMLQDGRDFNYDEAKIRSLFPTDTANEMIGNLEDARTIGQQVTAVRGMPLADILNQEAANHKVLGNSTGETYTRQRRLSDAFDKAAEQHIKALGSDPAGYVSTTNPQILAAHDEMTAQAPEQAAMLRGHGQPTAAESYAAKVLGEEDRLGVPPDNQHVLDNMGAASIARQIMADPEQAPARMKALETQWGSQWPKVWSDLSMLGKLPASYQMVGALENEGDGALLARALAHSNQEGVNKSLDDVLDRGATGTTRPSQMIRTRVEGSEDVQSYTRSMLASGASDAQVRGIVSSISLLAQAKALYHSQPPAAAADDAVQSAVGKWEFLPQGGARIPRANADAITDNAQKVVSGLTLGAVQPPAIYSRPGQSPGAATADDWLRVLQASPNWVTVGQSIRLMDNGGRFVRRPGGGFIEVPFNVAAAPAPAAPIAPAVNEPPF